MKIKPHYVLIKYRRDHPQNKSKTSLYKIWKEYDSSHIYGSALYDVVDYFNSYSEARKSLKLLSFYNK